MKQNYFETILGAVVLLTAGLFLYFTYMMGISNHISSGYDIKAKFNHIDGISIGNDVRIGGVKVGSVEKVDLDLESYEAIVTLSLREGLNLPEDTSAEILSDGLMGGKFINITPGGSLEKLKPNEMIDKTQSSVGLEQLLSKFLFSPSKS